MGGRSFIDGIPIEEIPEEERMEMFNIMLIRAVHSIGFKFAKEEENYPYKRDSQSKTDTKY